MSLEVPDAYYYDEEVILDMQEKEWNTMPSATDIDLQPEISWGLRTRVILTMIQLHEVLRLRLETLHLAINIMDRYTSITPRIQRSTYRLLGLTSILVATKFDDIQQRVPSIRNMVLLTGCRYHRTEYISMEKTILNTLGWSLYHPTAEAWYRIMSTIGGNEEAECIQEVARFLMELTLFYRDFVDYRPSQIALGALSLSRYLCTGTRRSSEETTGAREVMQMLDFALTHYRSEIPALLFSRHRNAAALIFDIYNASNIASRR